MLVWRWTGYENCASVKTTLNLNLLCIGSRAIHLAEELAQTR